MQVIHPNTPELIRQRDALLQDALREENLPFSIAEEYPIVLDPKNPKFSFCVVDENNVVAHANYWFRNIVDRQNKVLIKTALIGNVATHKDWRNRGLMKVLMQHLEQVALQEHVQLFILWSDLLKFYQNLGYASQGNEYRYYFNLDKLKTLAAEGENFLPIDLGSLKESDLEILLTYRSPAKYTVGRSADEFKRLTSIPVTSLFINERNSHSCYLFMGRGYDMAGVIHEWGAPDPLILLKGVKHILESCGFPDVILLVPPTAEAPWHEAFEKYASRHEKTSLALFKKLDQKLEDDVINEMFIWGFDSI